MSDYIASHLVQFLIRKAVYKRLQTVMRLT